MYGIESTDLSSCNNLIVYKSTAYIIKLLLVLLLIMGEGEGV